MTTSDIGMVGAEVSGMGSSVGAEVDIDSLRMPQTSSGYGTDNRNGVNGTVARDVGGNTRQACQPCSG